MYRNITVNGFVLDAAKVRFGIDSFVVSGLTEDGYAVEIPFSFEDGVEISFGAQKAQEAAPVKKERKPRKAKAQPEVVEVAEAAPVVEMATDEQYAEYLTQRASGKRGRAPKAIAAYIAAHNL